MAERLAEKLTPPLTPERLDRQWRGIEARTRVGAWWPPRGNFRLVFAGAALAAAVTAAVLVSRPNAPQAIAGSTFDNASTGPASLRLADGSQVQVAPSGRVELKAVANDNVELVLTRGWVELDVTHVPSRKFVVKADDVDVVVRGTRFRVELTGGDPRIVSVSVSRGKVDVVQRRNGALAKQLAAGMSWTMGQRELPKRDEPPAAADAAEIAPAPAPSAQAPAVASAREPEDAKRLMELADAARLRGQPREAAAALDSLRKRFRGDARAGLAALELGRLRLDTFRDAAGALEAFKDAAQLARAPSVREDALARQAQAHEVLGDVAGCQRVRDAYLARYPSGIHSSSIAKRCGGK